MSTITPTPPTTLMTKGLLWCDRVVRYADLKSSIWHAFLTNKCTLKQNGIFETSICCRHAMLVYLRSISNLILNLHKRSSRLNFKLIFSLPVLCSDEKYVSVAIHSMYRLWLQIYVCLFLLLCHFVQHNVISSDLIPLLRTVYDFIVPISNACYSHDNDPIRSWFCQNNCSSRTNILMN